MKFCNDHWTRLRAGVEAEGVSGWVAPNAEVAAEQLENQVTTGEDRPTNYDPLIRSWTMITERVIGIAGLQVFTEDFGCPICRLAERRAPDGSCSCGQETCGAKEPGSIPDFDTWLFGPTSAPAAAKAYMVEQGWVSEDGAPL